MTGGHPGSVAVGVCGSALVASVALFGWSVAGAAHIETVESGAVTVELARAGESPEPRRGDGSALIEAVRANPFSPRRVPPAERFSARAETATIDGDANGEADQVAPPRMIGLARTGDRAIVLASYEGAPSRLVRPGETIGLWRLEAVNGETATFVSTTGQSVEMTIDRPR